MNQFCILNYFRPYLILIALPKIQNTSIMICETCCVVANNGERIDAYINGAMREW